MTLAVVRNIGSAAGVCALTQDVEDFEQEIVDQYALAMAAAGLTDGTSWPDAVDDDRVRPVVAGAVVGGDVRRRGPVPGRAASRRAVR